jgi:UDPglucose 6-dehydrogenase
VDEVNNDQKKIIIEKILNHYDNKITGKTFCVWGLAFKPKTDDMREAPSLTVINELLQAGAKVQAYDPASLHEAKHILNGSVTLCEDAIKATKDADAIILVTEWPEFRLPDWETILQNMNEHVVFDGRNIYNPDEMKEKGFAYYGIGIR